MKKIFLFVIPAMTVVLFSCKTEKKEPILLRLHLTKGQTFDVISEMKNNGGSAGAQISDKTRAILTVDSVLNDSSYLLSSKTDYIRSKVTGAGPIQNESFSSEMSESSMTTDQKEMMNEFREVLDSTFTLNITPRGFVLRSFSFSNGRELSKDAPPFDFSNFQLIYPENPVVAGETWSNQKKSPLTGATTSIDCRITDINDRTIEILTEGTMEIMPGMSNHLKGKYILDRKTMKTLKAIIDTESEFAGKITVTVTSN